MNVGDLQTTANSFRSDTANKINSLNDKIGDIKGKIEDGFNSPVLFHSIMEGIGKSAPSVTKTGRTLRTIGDAIHSQNRKIGEMDDMPSDFRHYPERTPTQIKSTNNSNLYRDDAKGLSDGNGEKPLSKDSPVNEVELQESKVKLGPRGQGRLGGDENIPKPSQPERTIATKEGGEEGEHILSSIGKGMESIGESGIPFLSEIGDVGAAAWGVGEGISSIFKSKKEKALEQQKKNLEQVQSPSSNIITGGGSKVGDYSNAPLNF